eukprot:9226016-Alexandrium_andersonii.AAC.1
MQPSPARGPQVIENIIYTHFGDNRNPPLPPPTRLQQRGCHRLALDQHELTTFRDFRLQLQILTARGSTSSGTLTDAQLQTAPSASAHAQTARGIGQ